MAGLLCPDPSRRLGSPRAGGIEALKQHVFFVGLDWVAIPNPNPNPDPDPSPSPSPNPNPEP